MPTRHPYREFAFTLIDTARLLRTLSDQEVRRMGMTRAQWAVLARIERNEGLKQSEIAEILEIQPITLTRLVDRLAENGLIERRPDEHDRRAWRLYLTPAAKPLVDRLDGLGREMMRNVLKGVSDQTVARLTEQIGTVRDNIRSELIAKDTDTNSKSKTYG
jgi:MarR family transcriptional regulator for hemolysin